MEVLLRTIGPFQGHKHHRLFSEPPNPPKRAISMITKLYDIKKVPVPKESKKVPVAKKVPVPKKYKKKSQFYKKTSPVKKKKSQFPKI